MIFISLEKLLNQNNDYFSKILQRTWPLFHRDRDFFGLSVIEKDVGPAIVVNVWDRIPVERWIFSVTHELGHLLLHFGTYNVEESGEVPAEEEEANVFASYFLMPEEAFNSEWKETYGLHIVDRVLKVKRIFQVSYKTVLYRLSETFGPSIWGKYAPTPNENYPSHSTIEPKTKRPCLP